VIQIKVCIDIEEAGTGSFKKVNECVPLSLQPVSEEELQEVFSRVGKIRTCWVAKRPAGFAFLTYDDPRDAEDAVKE